MAKCCLHKLIINRISIVDTDWNACKRVATTFMALFAIFILSIHSWDFAPHWHDERHRAVQMVDRDGEEKKHTTGKERKKMTKRLWQRIMLTGPQRHTHTHFDSLRVFFFSCVCHFISLFFRCCSAGSLFLLIQNGFNLYAAFIWKLPHINRRCAYASSSIEMVLRH